MMMNRWNRLVVVQNAQGQQQQQYGAFMSQGPLRRRRRRRKVIVGLGCQQSSLFHSSSKSMDGGVVTRRRLGVGGSRFVPIGGGNNNNNNSNNNMISQYASVIATALQNGVGTLDCGHEGESMLKESYQHALRYCADSNISLPNEKVQITSRLGYRQKQVGGVSSSSSSSSFEPKHVMDDVTLGSGGGSDDTMDGSALIHNMSPDYVNHAIDISPLKSLTHDNDNVDWTCMIHNPETQALELSQKGASTEEVQDFLKHRLVQCFQTLQNNDQITSYGVWSNGLSLPSWHPLSLSWKSVLEAAQQASSSSDPNNNKFNTIQLPANLLETQGLSIARQIKQYNNDNNNLFPNLQIHSFRPLSCYPDLGTSSNANNDFFKLVDYPLPVGDDAGKVEFTNQFKRTPMSYTAALNRTMSHFDATHLVEKDVTSLTVEERETLEACRLIQSMIHDLDQMLTSGIRSISAYESHLFNQVIPLLHDSLEEFDETSADVLQQYFVQHGYAVRYTVAKETRRLLLHPEQNPNTTNNVDTQGLVQTPQSHDVPANQSLQEYALQYLWKQKFNNETTNDDHHSPLIDKVIVGCPKPEYVIEAVQAMDRMNNNS